MHIPAHFYQRASTATSWDVELADNVAICIACGVIVLFFIILAVVLFLACKSVWRSGVCYGAETPRLWNITITPDGQLQPNDECGSSQWPKASGILRRMTDFAQGHVAQYGTVSGAQFFAKRYAKLQ
ncbi:hypothetical protein VP1G_10712 [Cytospora mali]|uniref:Uncharacterized protein n=1 Tax=Cytospora mali TaxID=578113 RepID=A0A194UTB0_CYTMA|nr:hypothetical protein VP1G_10712 [Valsa mali var. pyri (nom. inval.)]